jgi:hypothetical protein
LQVFYANAGKDWSDFQSCFFLSHILRIVYVLKTFSSADSTTGLD